MTPVDIEQEIKKSTFIEYRKITSTVQYYLPFFFHGPTPDRCLNRTAMLTRPGSVAIDGSLMPTYFRDVVGDGPVRSAASKFRLGPGPVKKKNGPVQTLHFFLCCFY